MVTCEATQFIGTLAAVYGWFVEPIGWTYALIVWSYALVWFLINSAVKIWVYGLMRHGLGGHGRHLTRISATLHSKQVFAKDR